MVTCRDPAASKLPWKGRKRWGCPRLGSPGNGPRATNQSSESPYHTGTESTGSLEEEKTEAGRERERAKVLSTMKW